VEKMPYRPEIDAAPASLDPRAFPFSADLEASVDWRLKLPTLVGQQVTLRELRASDATSLYALLTTDEVARFISPPPTTVEGFEGFIAWTSRQRVAGAYASFAVTVRGFDTAIGIFQVRETERGFATAEWGFAIGSPFWGTGVFEEGAELVMEFVFNTLRVHRLEARAAVLNGRGNSALRKIGALKEGILRKSLLCGGQYLDQALYAILDSDWRGSRTSMPFAASVARSSIVAKPQDRVAIPGV
jgi:[ribosomal protein S5]-alanine N-acetyltransferase